jgi:hypothetical protein
VKAKSTVSLAFDVKRQFEFFYFSLVLRAEEEEGKRPSGTVLSLFHDETHPVSGISICRWKLLSMRISASQINATIKLPRRLQGVEECFK